MNPKSLVDSLNWKDHKNVWAAFWFQKLGYYPGTIKMEKTGIHLPIEETRKRDEEIEVAFLDFVQNTYCK
jgi:hypothetical protein